MVTDGNRKGGDTDRTGGVVSIRFRTIKSCALSKYLPEAVFWPARFVVEWEKSLPRDAVSRMALREAGEFQLQEHDHHGVGRRAALPDQLIHFHGRRPELFLDDGADTVRVCFRGGVERRLRQITDDRFTKSALQQGR